MHGEYEFNIQLVVNIVSLGLKNPYNVGSVLQRLFSTVGDSISTCGGCSVLWRLFSTVGE